MSINKTSLLCFVLQAADLAAKGTSFSNTKCVITGWGQTSGSGSVSQHLLEAKITKITNFECQRTWLFQTITSKHICVYEASGKLSCHISSFFFLFSLFVWIAAFMRHRARLLSVVEDRIHVKGQKGLPRNEYITQDCKDIGV